MAAVEKPTDDGSGSQFISHIPCEHCGSKDNAALYTDHTYCFGCKTHTPGDATQHKIMDAPELPKTLIDGHYSALPVRALTEETCRKFDYRISKYKKSPVQVANYRDTNGSIVAQKIRDVDKNFSILGDAKKMTLYGQHLWNSGKKLVVCEGEIDAMSVSQVQNHKWATVSLPNGCQSGKKALVKAWDYLQQFEEIILFFDQDEAGQQAAKECAEALPIGKAKIAKLSYKDANEALVANQPQAIINAIWQAKEYRPDGIVSSNDLRSTISEHDVASTITYPWSKLNDLTRGIRPGELVTLCAGSGVGKSTMIRELAYHLHKNGSTVGLLMLEESNKRTLQGLVGLELRKNITIDPEAATKEEIEGGFDALFGEKPIYLFDHFGSTALDIIVNRIQFMVRGMGCTHVFLDHISILVSGLTGKVADERRLIDDIMTTLRKLVQELNIGLVLVSHLKRPANGGGHEAGSKVRLSELRGSHSLAQLADMCIGLQVDSEEPNADKRQLVLLKNRYTGEVGFAGNVKYNRHTGRLMDADNPECDIPF